MAEEAGEHQDRRRSPVALAVHAHFYQPPRENPWTEEVNREASAAPFHDWNTRISAECYRPNAFARIFDHDGRVLRIVNNYEHLSFNVGPTLMSWLERHQPAVYARIQAAAAGGGAIAQAYNHTILPLANERDARTQVRWGRADFRHRFGAEPAGMWLPETAVDDTTLAILAEEGVGFTILAPSQIKAVRSLSAKPGAWREPAKLDTRVPYRWLHPSAGGKRGGLGVDLVVYHGPMSHDLAFSSVPSEVLIDRATAAAGRRGGLVAVALDGETFGHHHKWADRALAYALSTEAPRRDVTVTNLAAWLTSERPLHEASVHTSAWSCVHGVGRWSTDCGCSTGGAEGSDQKWRAPLRAALDRLRDFGVEVFERHAGLFAGDDPWAARDAYVDVLIGATTVDAFAERFITGDRVLALTLLEAQRNAMLMYTSCGWFFHDLAGLETIQVLRYAARVLDLLAEAGASPPEEEFLEILGMARSFDQGDGRELWTRLVRPARVEAERVAAHLVLADLFGLGEPGDHLANFTLESLGAGRGARSGGAATAPVQLAWRRVRLTHRRTGRSGELVAVALRLGEHAAAGAVRAADWPHDAMTLDTLRRLLEEGTPPAALLDRAVTHFGSGRGRTFDIGALLPEAAEELLDRAAAGLAAHMAEAAEPFLAAAHWAVLTRPADSQPPDAESIAADGAAAGGTGADGNAPAGTAAHGPEEGCLGGPGPDEQSAAARRRTAALPPALRVAAETALAYKLEAHLGGGELQAAVDLAAQADAVGLSLEGTQAAGSGPAAALSRIVTGAVRRAVARADENSGDQAVRMRAEALAEAIAALDLAAELHIHPNIDEAQELVYEALTSNPGSGPDLTALASALKVAPAPK